MISRVILSLFLLKTLVFITFASRHGPDPWDNVVGDESSEGHGETYIDTPPDLRIPFKKKTQTSGNLGNGEWFFKRALAIMINGGQTKVNDDGSIEVSLQMKYAPEHWQTLNEFTKSNLGLTEDMFRRSIAYVEDAIYKPSISERISMAWSEYIQTFIMENKTHIVWCFGILAAAGLTFWLWKHMSHKHVIILIILALYLYEVIISYKEAEKQELDKFLSAVNKCSWYFWKSTCEVPPPDPIVFMKHMNPLKIGLRMFTTILSEPMIAISGTVNTIVHDITDGLWFPLDIVIHSILIISINVMLIAFLIMIIFNYILNIPFSLSLGLASIQVKQRNRIINLDSSNNNSRIQGTTDKISGATLNKILDVFSLALDNKITSKSPLNATNNHMPTIKRSSSTGRLPSSSLTAMITPETNLKRRQKASFMIGGGDSKK